MRENTFTNKLSKILHEKIGSPVLKSSNYKIGLGLCPVIKPKTLKCHQTKDTQEQDHQTTAVCRWVALLLCKTTVPTCAPIPFLRSFICLSFSPWNTFYIRQGEVHGFFPISLHSLGFCLLSYYSCLWAVHFQTCNILIASNHYWLWHEVLCY